MEKSGSRLSSALKISFINIAVFFCLAGAIELLAKLGTLLYIRNYTSSLNWEIELHPSGGIVHTKRDYRRNPNASDSVSDSIFFTSKVYGAGSKSFKILTLGGSTTDALGTHFSGINQTWPDQLGKALSAKIPEAKVWIDNAGIGGASSSQELLRLIQSIGSSDGDYDLVISMNGINEIYFTDEIYSDPDLLYSPKLSYKSIKRNRVVAYNGNYYSQVGDFYSVAAIKRLLRLLNKRNEISKDALFRPQNSFKLKSAADMWLKNVTLMDAVSNARNARYLTILQPTLGLSCKQGSTSCLNNFVLNSSYAQNMSNLYSKLRAHCKTLDYCLDLSSVNQLTEDEELYKDPRHMNSAGNKALTYYILKHLHLSNLLDHSTMKRKR